VLGSPAELVRAVAQLQAASTTSSTSATGDAAELSLAISRCDAALRRIDPELGARLLTAQAAYQGTAALVLVYGIDRDLHPAANGSTRIDAVDRSTCAVLTSRTM
jgi:hypothetical protein